MIEVEFGDFYKKCAEMLFCEGFKSFHMDFGDKICNFMDNELKPEK